MCQARRISRIASPSFSLGASFTGTFSHFHTVLPTRAPKEFLGQAWRQSYLENTETKSKNQEELRAHHKKNHTILFSHRPLAVVNVSYA
jgi:hypothetical protein